MDRETLEEKYGQVWDTEELRADFEVICFSYGCCIAKRRSDGVRGLIEFQHNPRFYFDFTPTA